MFNEVVQEYCDLSDEFDTRNMKINVYLESTVRLSNIHREEAELKVMTEGGTEYDLAYLVEEANDGAIASIKKAIQAIIEAFKQFISDLKSKVVRIVVNADTKVTLKKVEKKVAINPFLKKKKIQVIDKRKPLKVIAAYKAKADTCIAKVKSGAFKEKDIQGIYDLKEKYQADYKKVIAGTAAMMTISVGKLVNELAADYGKLPAQIDHIDKETSQIMKNYLSTLDKEEAAAAKAAYTAVANFRTKVAKDEASEYVDGVLHKLAMLKKEVLKAKEMGGKHVVKQESADDDYLNDLFDGYLESAEDDEFDMDLYSESAEDADSLLSDLDHLLI